MARVNLLTIHWGCSYGGTMQTYATLKTLQELGHKVTLINLVHPKYKHNKKILSLGYLFGCVRRIQFELFRFVYFRQMTRKMYKIEKNLIPPCDYCVVGSDQVWNSDITSPINLYYFLGFENNAKKISYASSFGKSEWNDNKDITLAVREALAHFSAISVREISGVRICKGVFDVDAQQLLDPTMVRLDYDELIRSHHQIKEIFPFLLVENEETKKICHFISEAMNIPLYKLNRFRLYFGRSPKEWLRRMKNSSYIITDSFHGLAFSLLFHKKFLVLCADTKKFTRLQSLLQLLNLEERYIQSYEDLLKRKDIINSPIDFESVDAILNEERRKSFSFLTKNIK